LPATTVIACTATSGERRAMMSATASSEAVSVSMIIFVVMAPGLARQSYRRFRTLVMPAPEALPGRPRRG
jgi:hypothetical protein